MRTTLRLALDAAAALGLASGLALALLAAAAEPRAASAAALDLELYARLLERYTHPVPDVAGTRVDYAGLRTSSDWEQLLRGLSAADPAALGARAEREAFWINAYNILAIDLVRRHYPVESIRDIGSLLFPVWKREAGAIGGRAYTLDEIEHRILRPLGDPRIHAAIVCASTSCPSLRREPYRASDLDAQLDASLRTFLADPEKGLRVDAARRVVVLSKIFDWFADDFAKQGGVLAFAQPYLARSVQEELAALGPEAPLEYFEYDWRLNDLAHHL